MISDCQDCILTRLTVHLLLSKGLREKGTTGINLHIHRSPESHPYTIPSAPMEREVESHVKVEPDRTPPQGLLPTYGSDSNHIRTGRMGWLTCVRLYLLPHNSTSIGWDTDISQIATARMFHTYTNYLFRWHIDCSKPMNVRFQHPSERERTQNGITTKILGLAEVTSAYLR